MPEDVYELVLDLYLRLSGVRITDILLEVGAATGFTDDFTHLRTGAPCKDRTGFPNALLAEGLNPGLSKMAEAATLTTSTNNSRAPGAGTSKARR